MKDLKEKILTGATILFETRGIRASGIDTKEKLILIQLLI